ncbi:MAG: hypothetical protein CTY31_10585 [Hyphomicrobium sp.]|nr:MAG: hypothetical protein CTY31_10585 [Hyphomicrobium sp.]
MMQRAQMRLQDTAQIKPGHPFRGAIEALPDGDAAVVHIRDADPNKGIDWPALVRTELQGRKDPDWLRAGDILFAARGNRNFAACVGEPPVKAVCSPHFFVVRINPGSPATPEFVTWLLNQPEAQKYFAQSAEGTFITSIRRQVLEDIPLTLPPLPLQRTIIALHHAALREKELLEQLIANRQQQLNIISKQILN